MLAALVPLYFAITFMPLMMLCWTSSLPFRQTLIFEALTFVTLANYRDILVQPLIHQAATNTVLLVFTSATLATGLAGLIAWYSVRSGRRSARWLDGLAFMPIAVP